MKLRIITVNGKTDISDGRGNTLATLYGVVSMEHDGKVPVTCLLSEIKTSIKKVKPMMYVSEAIAKSAISKGKKGN